MKKTPLKTSPSSQLLKRSRSLLMKSGRGRARMAVPRVRRCCWLRLTGAWMIERTGRYLTALSLLFARQALSLRPPCKLFLTRARTFREMIFVLDSYRRLTAATTRHLPSPIIVKRSIFFSILLKWTNSGSSSVSGSAFAWPGLFSISLK